MAKKRAVKKPARRVMKKPVKKPARKPVAKAVARKIKKPAAKAKAKPKRPPKRAPKRAVKPAPRPPSWFDAASHKPLIGDYVQRLEPFINALADGEIDNAELSAQEKRLVTAMKAVEPKLDAATHGRVTELLCELATYDVMQMLHAMQTSRPKASFQG
jgi:hypothetical protein